MLLHRYADMNYIKSLDIVSLSKLLVHANKQIQKEMMFDLYLADRPYLKDNLSFDKYLIEVQTQQAPRYDMRPKDEIMQELLGGKYGTV